ncbi:MAG: NAD(P)-dependent oxidoreductase [Coriobacteriia bacterium]|nr:NAD(P)-dependent oxidoreductase [Coriobacteriia bacterium]
MRIAILGATGHVGRSLAAELGARDGIDLALVARAPDRARAFAQTRVAGAWEVASFSELAAVDADLVVQCAGVGDPARLGMDVLEIEERLDESFLGWLAAHPSARGVAFSSGAVYDSTFDVPVDDCTPLCDPARTPEAPGEAYAIAKSRSEARHRASGLPVVDLRLFGYFTRLIDPDAAFLMNDLVRALRTGTDLVISPGEIVRDYADPTDLADLVLAAGSSGATESALDVVSASPVSRSTLLEHFVASRALGYTVRDVGGPASVTGAKPAYYSVSRRAEGVGFRPRHSAIETLDREVEALLMS